ncbi:zinc ribbon domain-containing protein [Dermatophilus congolensis]|nr:C4-type zinc ribbon domain-containing protein [Dermatophilus congolensis]
MNTDRTTMKADPGQQWKLLDLASLDTRTAQIAHRRANLPEAEAAAAALRTLEELEAELVRARTDLSDTEREATKAAADVRIVIDRIKRTTARLDDGSASARELQNLQSELESLERRRSVLESERTVVDKRARVLRERVTDLEPREAEASTALTQARAAEKKARNDLDDAEHTISRSRQDFAEGVQSDLLALYEKIRASTGMGAAALTQRRCGGCNLELLGRDLHRVATAPLNEVVRCENCSRIIVRTSDSGL